MPKRKNRARCDGTLSKISIQGPNASQFQLTTPTDTPQCALTSLNLTASGGACFIAVAFAPTTIDDVAANVEVDVTFGIRSFRQLVGLSGSGLALLLDSSPLDVTFRATLIGTTQLTDSGYDPECRADAHITAVSINGINAADFKGERRLH
jgi:hypothetical protein